MCHEPAEGKKEERERIAQDLGWDSYEAAPSQVQRNIDSLIEGPRTEDPFALLRAVREGE